MAEKQNKTSVVLCKGCGGRRCPEISLEPDGSFVLWDEDQSAPGRVVMTREQAEVLRDELSRLLVLKTFVPTPRAQNPGFEGEDAIDRTFRQGNL